jgi:hypothetical protein
MATLEGYEDELVGIGVEAAVENLIETEFSERIQELRRSEKEKISFPKKIAHRPPSRFTPTPLALPRDKAIQTYRDDRVTNSIHLVEYPNRWEIHEDTINPEHGPKHAVLHAIADAPEETAETLVALNRLLEN